MLVGGITTDRDDPSVTLSFFEDGDEKATYAWLSRMKPTTMSGFEYGEGMWLAILGVRCLAMALTRSMYTLAIYYLCKKPAAKSNIAQISPLAELIALLPTADEDQCLGRSAASPFAERSHAGPHSRSLVRLPRPSVSHPPLLH